VPITSPYDRAWRAALDAARFEGVRIVHEDQKSGLIIGTKGQEEITIRMRQQADGKVQMEITMRGREGAEADPHLPGRITRAYERRMAQ
jgi:hypothetical protein